MAKCPKCGNKVNKPIKEWDYGPKKNPKKFHVMMYQCDCGKRFREYLSEGKVKFVL